MRTVDQRPHRALAAVSERELDDVGIRPHMSNTARDRRRDRDSIGASFERLGSDEDPANYLGNDKDDTERSSDDAHTIE